ncbi:MAG: hypothetical protein HC773_10330 [Scytonema sp. CRU_2_7]|nr:hypothetical protein [Scytonema sp. CRU_2_7]
MCLLSLAIACLIAEEITFEQELVQDMIELIVDLQVRAIWLKTRNC